MRMNAKELIVNARVTAPPLPPAAAKLMTDMANRLNIQFAALHESREQARTLKAQLEETTKSEWNQAGDTIQQQAQQLAVQEKANEY